MFKTNYSARNKIWGGTKEIWGRTAPECPPWLRACSHLCPPSVTLLIVTNVP